MIDVRASGRAAATKVARGRLDRFLVSVEERSQPVEFQEGAPVGKIPGLRRLGGRLGVSGARAECFDDV